MDSNTTPQGIKSTLTHQTEAKRGSGVGGLCVCTHTSVWKEECVTFTSDSLFLHISLAFRLQKGRNHMKRQYFKRIQEAIIFLKSSSNKPAD